MAINEVIKDLVIAVVAGVSSVGAAIYFTPDWEVTAREKGWVSLPEWKTTATKAGWIKADKCPAFPISIELTSPGINTTIPFEDSPYTGGGTELETKFIVTATRPIPDQGSIGIIFSPDNKSDFYVVFPLWTEGNDNKIFSHSSLRLPIKLKGSEKAEIYAFFTSNKHLYGEVYATFEQVVNQDPEVVVTNKVVFNLRKRE